MNKRTLSNIVSKWFKKHHKEREYTTMVSFVCSNCGAKVVKK